MHAIVHMNADSLTRSIREGGPITSFTIDTDLAQIRGQGQSLQAVCL